MLTGPDLLAKVKELGDVSKSELVRSCGYVSSKKDGSERLNFTAFYEALLEAKGFSLGETGGKGVGATGSGCVTGPTGRGVDRVPPGGAGFGLEGAGAAGVFSRLVEGEATVRLNSSMNGFGPSRP